MVVLLADLEGFSYKEIGEILEIPVGTVMSRLYRGRKLLEAAMLEYAREHGYIRGGAEPAKMRSREAPSSGRPGAGSPARSGIRPQGARLEGLVEPEPRRICGHGL